MSWKGSSAGAIVVRWPLRGYDASRADMGMRHSNAAKIRLWQEVHGCALAVPVPCHWCGSRISFNQATVDHVRPRSEGGADDLANVVVACDDCNQLRNRLNQIGVW